MHLGAGQKKKNAPGRLNSNISKDKNIKAAIHIII
jgi:hypothetical protein